LLQVGLKRAERIWLKVALQGRNMVRGGTTVREMLELGPLGDGTKRGGSYGQKWNHRREVIWLEVGNGEGKNMVSVLNPGKGVCADPVERGAILEVEGPGPPSGDSEHQLSPDRGGGKT
jgi:hypothetical protein